MAAVRLKFKRCLAPPLVLIAIVALLLSACAKPALPADTPAPATNLPATTTITTTPAPTGPNQPPIIVEIETSEQQKIKVWTTTVIKCIVEDPDGDQLTYSWSATGGKILGEGKEIGWIAPGIKGEYAITVRATDGRGGKAEGSITLDVFCCDD